MSDRIEDGVAEWGNPIAGSGSALSGRFDIGTTPPSQVIGDRDMRHSKISVFVLGAAGLLPHFVVPALAECQVISATHGAHWQGQALTKSQALAARSANELKAQKGWRSFTMKAYPVKPEPFFKTVRPEVTNDVTVGSFITARTYTTCCTGITVPFVCTSGSQVCRR